jgi:hypothetical protein
MPRRTLSTKLYALARAAGKPKWQAVQLAGSRGATRRAMSNSAARIEARPEFDKVLAEVEKLVLVRHLDAMVRPPRALTLPEEPRATARLALHPE